MRGWPADGTLRKLPLSLRQATLVSDDSRRCNEVQWKSQPVERFGGGFAIDCVGKEAAGEPGCGKEFRLRGKGGQAHNLAHDKANIIRLPYRVVIIIWKPNSK